LQQAADLESVAEVLRGNVQAGERLARKSTERPERALYLHYFERTLQFAQ
jgi:hypothetical protein